MPIVAGMTLAKLLAATGCDQVALERALEDEVRRGRVAVVDGCFSLVPGSLPAAVGRALRALGRPGTADPIDSRLRRTSQRDPGACAYADEGDDDRDSLCPSRRGAGAPFAEESRTAR
jgi:hypothetical protein